MALTAAEQELLDFALAALPHWFQEGERPMEELGASAKVMGAAKAQTAYWMGQTLIGQATGVVGDEPDWLNQHAIDRGTSRQDGESDAELRTRLRVIADAVTRPALLAAAQAIVDAIPVVGTVVMVELKRDRAFFGTSDSDAGTGGTFTDLGGGEFKFEASPRFREPLDVLFTGGRGNWGPPQLIISGALSAANDGTYPIKRLDLNGVVIDNAGVAEVDVGASWTIQKRDEAGNVVDGFARAFMSRGYRMGDSNAEITLILPFGCTPATQTAVLEMLRQKKAAGVQAIVECRINP